MTALPFTLTDEMGRKWRFTSAWWAWPTAVLVSGPLWMLPWISKRGARLTVWLGPWALVFGMGEES